MSITRLHEGFGVGQDSCVSGRHPMTEQDILSGTEGVYLGRNPASLGEGLFLTFWEADEIAQKIGFPHIEVYHEQTRLVDEQARRIAELEHQLNAEVHNLQLKAVSTQIKNSNKEILSVLEDTLAAVRARLGDSGSKPATAPRSARPAGGTPAV